MKRMRHNHGATFRAQRTFADKKVTGLAPLSYPMRVGKTRAADLLCLGRGRYPLVSCSESSQDRLLHTDRQHGGYGVVILILVQVAELWEETDRVIAHRCFVSTHHKPCLSKESYPI